MYTWPSLAVAPPSPSDCPDYYDGSQIWSCDQHGLREGAVSESKAHIQFENLVSDNRRPRSARGLHVARLYLPEEGFTTQMS